MNALEEWTTELSGRLGLGAVLDRDAVLDLARDAAHAVARPAAPLTAFLVGYAAGANPERAESVFQTAQALAQEWEARHQSS